MENKLINFFCPSVMSHHKIWKVFEKSNFPKSIDHAGMITYRDTRINHRSNYARCQLVILCI